MSTWLALAWVASGVGLPRSAPPPAAPTPIIGGEAVSNSEWRSVVEIISPDPDDRTLAHLCSGTLIAPKIVLTAAHCIPQELEASKISVYFGTRMTSQQRATVKRFGLHPEACVDDCDPEAHDFAFLEINEDVHGFELIPPLRTQEEWDEAMLVGAPVTLVGFGAVRDAEEEGAAPLREDERGYKREVTTRIARFTPNGLELLAGEDGKDTCGGDSGGPAFVQLADGSWRQVGVTSRGVRPCGTGRGYYGVPYFVLPWLRDEAGVDLLPADCPDADCIDVKRDDGCGCDAAPASPWALGLVLLLGLGRPGSRGRSRAGQ